MAQARNDGYFVTASYGIRNILPHDEDVQEFSDMGGRSNNHHFPVRGILLGIGILHSEN